MEEEEGLVEEEEEEVGGLVKGEEGEEAEEGVEEEGRGEGSVLCAQKRRSSRQWRRFRGFVFVSSSPSARSRWRRRSGRCVECASSIVS